MSLFIEKTVWDNELPKVCSGCGSKLTKTRVKLPTHHRFDPFSGELEGKVEYDMHCSKVDKWYKRVANNFVFFFDGNIMHDHYHITEDPNYTNSYGVRTPHRYIGKYMYL